MPKDESRLKAWKRASAEVVVQLGGGSTRDRRRNLHQQQQLCQLSLLSDTAVPQYNHGPILIYVLVDPRDYSIRYVGKTNNPSRRLRQHCENPNYSNFRVHNWLRMLIGRGLAPKMIIVGRAPPHEWEQAERAWIAFLRERGRIYNIHDGGRHPRDATTSSIDSGTADSALVL
jgi:hypothetical protein